MSVQAVVEAQIDADVRDRAEAVLHSQGMTIPDAVRMLLTRTAEDGILPFSLEADAVAHDSWFREQVQEALDDSTPGIPHETVMQDWATQRAELLTKVR